MLCTNDFSHSLFCASIVLLMFCSLIVLTCCDLCERFGQIHQNQNIVAGAFQFPSNTYNLPGVLIQERMQFKFRYYRVYTLMFTKHLKLNFTIQLSFPGAVSSMWLSRKMVNSILKYCQTSSLQPCNVLCMFCNSWLL